MAEKTNFHGLLFITGGRSLFFRAFPGFLLAALYLAAWARPFLLGAGTPDECIAVLLLEFITIHAMAVIIAAWREPKMVLLLLVYLPILFGVGKAVGGPIILIAVFAWNSINKLRVTSAGKEADRSRYFVDWICSTLLFFITLILAGSLPLPDWGWTESSVGTAAAWRSKEAGDLNFHLTPAFGTFYFIGRGFMEIFILPRAESILDWICRHQAD